MVPSVEVAFNFLCEQQSQQKIPKKSDMNAKQLHTKTGL